MPIFVARNLTLNQHFGTVNNNIDKNLIFGVHKERKKGKIMHFSAIHCIEPFDKCRSA